MSLRRRRWTRSGRLRDGFVHLDDESLKRVARRATRLPEIVAVTAVVASRVLGLQMFDAQLEGALALAHGRIVEMQTGEGKTLAAVPASRGMRAREVAFTSSP